MYFALICITLISSLVSLYYASLALIDKKNSETAYYAFVRSVISLVVIVVAVASGSKDAVYLSALLMALIQLGDTFVGLKIADTLKTYGPLAVAIVSLTLLFINISS